MGRKRSNDEQRLNRLIEGLLLSDEPLTRIGVVKRIFSNKISAKDLNRLLDLGLAKGLITVQKGYREYLVRKPYTLVSATTAARDHFA